MAIYEEYELLLGPPKHCKVCGLEYESYELLHGRCSNCNHNKTIKVPKRVDKTEKKT